jgi:hypothetical protein
MSDLLWFNTKAKALNPIELSWAWAGEGFVVCMWCYMKFTQALELAKECLLEVRGLTSADV